MAWPNTPLQSFSDGTPPFVEALTLNSIQETINQIINGTIQMTGIVLINTGGGTPVPLNPPKAGGVDFTSLITSTTVPTPNAVGGYGRIGIGSVTRGWCVLTGAGVMLRGWNVYSVGRTPMGAAQGDYTIVYHAGPTDLTNVCVYGSIIGNGTPATWDAVASAAMTRQSVRVNVYDLAGTRTDRQMCVGIYAE